MTQLLQPVQCGGDLRADIQSTQVQAGQAAIWWLGQSGYAIKTASSTFYVDLYLSEHLTAKYAETEKPHIRMTAAPIRGHELTDVRLVFSSHKHSDHLDPGTLPDLFAASPQATLVLPTTHVEHTVNMGLDAARFVTVRGDDDVTEIDGLKVTAIPASHPDLAYTETAGYACVGFVFEVDGVAIYHSGDTIIYDGLIERLQQYDLDIAFLPINGTDARRQTLGVAPNMSIADAIHVAQAANAQMLIPHHYDMFTFNTVDVADFVATIKPTDQPYQVLRCAQKYIYTRTSS